MALDADNNPCWSMNSTHKHSVPVLAFLQAHFGMVVTGVRKLCCVYLVSDDDLAGR